MPMNRRRNWKKQFFYAICAGLLFVCSFSLLAGNVSAVESVETQPVQTDQSQTEQWTKGQKIAGFLVIFTVFCGGTAYLVMRPSLKKLKEAKRQAAETKSDSETKPKI